MAWIAHCYHFETSDRKETKTKYMPDRDDPKVTNR